MLSHSGEVQLSSISHVLEFEVDLSDLIVGEAVFRSVDQIFDSCKLVDENKILIVSKVVDGVKESVQGVWF